MECFVFTTTWSSTPVIHANRPQKLASVAPALVGRRRRFVRTVVVVVFNIFSLLSIANNSHGWIGGVGGGLTRGDYAVQPTLNTTHLGTCPNNFVTTGLSPLPLPLFLPPPSSLPPISLACYRELERETNFALHEPREMTSPFRFSIGGLFSPKAKTFRKRILYFPETVIIVPEFSSSAPGRRPRRFQCTRSQKCTQIQLVEFCCKKRNQKVLWKKTHHLFVKRSEVGVDLY